VNSIKTFAGTCGAILFPGLLASSINVASAGPTEVIARVPIPVQGVVSISGTPKVLISSDQANPVFVAPVGPTTPGGVPIYAGVSQPGSAANAVGAAWTASLDGGGTNPGAVAGRFFDINISDGANALLELPAPGLLEQVSGMCDNTSGGLSLKIEADVPPTPGVVLVGGPLLSTNTVVIKSLEAYPLSLFPVTQFSLLSGTSTVGTATYRNVYRISLLVSPPNTNAYAEHCHLTFQGRFLN
jgi:hypothetical protein